MLVSVVQQHESARCCVLVTQSCPTLCDTMDCSWPRSSVHGVFQTRILEWVAISFSRGSSQPRDWTQVSHTVGRLFTVWATREVQCMCTCMLNRFSCVRLCDPMDCSLLGSSIHGILQARILEWVAMPSSRGPSWPRDQTCVSCIDRWFLYHWATGEAPRW